MESNQKGDEALTKIILDNLNLVKYATTGLRQSNPHLHDDIISEGHLALVRSARNVQKLKLEGDDAKKYLVTAIKHQALQYCLESNTTVKAPRRPDLRKNLHQVYSINLPPESMRGHKFENNDKLRPKIVKKDNEVTEQDYEKFRLTGFEKSVAELLVKGHSREEIIKILDSTEWLVGDTIRNMRRKVKGIINDG